MGSGMVKDCRPINDKEWQCKTRDCIINFCLANGFANQMLNKKDFPLDSSKYKMMFEFMFGFVDPEYEFSSGQQFQQQLPSFLKLIGYPGTVSKSTFQTLGSMHSWPTALAVLHFVLTKAQVSMGLKTINNMFPPLDEDGLPFEDPQRESDDKIMFDFFRDCYDDYGKGDDNFESRLESLEKTSMLNLQVDEDYRQQLRDKDKQMEQQLTKLNAQPNCVKALEEQLRAAKEDMDKFQEYSVKRQKYGAGKQKELIECQEKVEKLSGVLVSLQASIDHLEHVCRTQKHVDPDKQRELEVEVQRLQRAVDKKRGDVKDVLAQVWKAETALGKCVAKVDSLCDTFNKKLPLEIQLEGCPEIMVDASTDPYSIQTTLQKLAGEVRTDRTRQEMEYNETVNNIEAIEQELGSKNLEIDSLDKEVVLKKDETNVATKETKMEEQELTRMLDQVRQEFAQCQKPNRPNLKGLEAELKKAMDEKAKAEESRKNSYVDELQLLDKTMAFITERQATDKKQKEEAVKVYKARVQKKVEAIQQLEKEVSVRVDKLVEENEKKK